MRRRLLSVLLSVAVLGTLFSLDDLFLVYGPPVQVIIPRDQSLPEILAQLHQEGVLTHPGLFRFLLRLTRRDRRLFAGEYLLHRPTPVVPLLLTLTSTHPPYLRRLTIPEGLNLEEIARRVESTLGIPAERFLARATDPDLISELHQRYPEIPDTLHSLEGYLYPETYLLAAGVDVDQVILAMVKELFARWTPALQQRAEALGWSLHQVLTLASIIEKEAVVPQEKPLISAVFHNRLRRGMPLAADPTVKYVLVRTGRRPSFRDVQVDSPYNTYRYRGLPPGPICSPDIQSIRAALYPADVPYLYFVAGPGGRHYFSRTFREHLRKKRLSKRLLGW